MSRFTHFIWKVFAVKILLSGKFLIFLTLEHRSEIVGEEFDARIGKQQKSFLFIENFRKSAVILAPSFVTKVRLSWKSICVAKLRGTEGFFPSKASALGGSLWRLSTGDPLEPRGVISTWCVNCRWLVRSSLGGTATLLFLKCRAERLEILFNTFRESSNQVKNWGGLRVSQAKLQGACGDSPLESTGAPRRDLNLMC